MNCLPGHPPFRDDGPGASLRIIANEVTRRGLEVRKYNHGIEVVEIVITNERDQRKGRISVGYDGLVTWEYGGNIETRPGIEKIRDIAVSLLAGDVPQPGPTRAS